MAALKNLPAEVIDKIQVFDKLSDQAQFTGFDDGNTVKVSILLQKQECVMANLAVYMRDMAATSVIRPVATLAFLMAHVEYRSWA